VSDDDGLDLARQVAQAYGRKAPGTDAGRRRRVRPARPTRETREDASPLSELLDKVVQDNGWEDKLADQRIFTDWQKLVGPEVAQHAVVEGFEDAVVHVRASSTAWATQLKMLAPRIVARLNKELGDGSVLRIDVRGPQAPSWKSGPRSIRGARGPRDTYG
jgi:predicted nucleic acid-binding Zn ribbon protein